MSLLFQIIFINITQDKYKKLRCYIPSLCSFDKLSGHVNLKTTKYSQSFTETIDQGLTEALVLGNGLQDLPIDGDVTDRPLAKPGTA